ncbi:MAG: hypothetical protein IT374_28215 [Polyangiaceae bacterium]|nr:hypothetical protein [Polyangiaceae bacterium]
MTLSQLALALLACPVLGSVAVSLDWSAFLMAADAAAIEVARFFMPVWDVLERLVSS